MSLQKSLFALLILTIASSVSSTACGSNPLLDIYGITAAFSDAQVVSGINYCKSLQNKDTCCDAATINGFQDKADELLKSLSSASALRDQSYMKIRKDLIPSLSGKITSFLNAGNNALDRLKAVLDTDYEAIEVMDNIGDSISLIGSLAGDLSEFKDDFTAYQKGRSTCVVDLVKIQAAAWCLACDPEYTSKGVSVSGIEFSEILVETLTDSCSAYLKGSVTQSMFFRMNLMTSFLTDFTSALKRIADHGVKGANRFSEVKTNMAASQSSLDQASMPVQLSSECNMRETGRCDWIASTLFNGGLLDEDSLVLGGEIQSYGTRRLEGASPRMLSGSWDPDTDEAGVKITFSNNPGSVDNSSEKSATLYKSIMGGLIVLFSVLLI